MLGEEERESSLGLVDGRLWGCKRDLSRRGPSLSGEALRAVCIFPRDDLVSVGFESAVLGKDDGDVDLVIGRAMEVFGDCNNCILLLDELNSGVGVDPCFIFAGLFLL